MGSFCFFFATVLYNCLGTDDKKRVWDEEKTVLFREGVVLLGDEVKVESFKIRATIEDSPIKDCWRETI